jgi:putative DNA primase/helicase
MLHGHRIRFEPKPEHVNATLDALKATVNVPASVGMPGWFGVGRPEGDLEEMVACTNGILHVPTRMLIRHTPKFWSPNILEFAFDPAARAPRFEQFLEEVWPGDFEAQECVLEMMGLCITDIIKYHKLWMFVGPRRGGRGTLGRVLRGLIGAHNYLGTSFKSFAEPFGMQSFIGKKVAAFSDANLDGITAKAMSTIVEQIKNLTGEDPQHVNRKNTKYWEGFLTTRLIILSNKLLCLEDESTALAGRFLIFRMQQSFYGREDVDLTPKLLAERPGILNLALDALARLKARGHPIQCQSGVEMAETFQEDSSKVSAFVAERCVVGVEHKLLLQTAYDAWKSFCDEHGIRFGWDDATFSRNLRSAVPAITSSRPRKGNTRGRPTMLYGIRLRQKGDLE